MEWVTLPVLCLGERDGQVRDNMRLLSAIVSRSRGGLLAREKGCAFKCTNGGGEGGPSSSSDSWRRLSESRVWWSLPSSIFTLPRSLLSTLRLRSRVAAELPCTSLLKLCLPPIHSSHGVRKTTASPPRPCPGRGGGPPVPVGTGVFPPAAPLLLLRPHEAAAPAQARYGSRDTWIVVKRGCVRLTCDSG